MASIEAERRASFDVEIRDARVEPSGNGGDRIFSGMAVVYDAPSEPLWTPRGSFREVILPGTINEELLARSSVELLYNHNPDSVMATTEAGTLDLTPTDEGLKVWARLDPEDPDVQRLESKVRRRSVTKMSFAFAMDDESEANDRWYEDEEGGIWREISRMSELFDVSAVGRPAYRQTSAALRTLEAAAAAGKISLPDDVAPVDPAGEETDLVSAEAETDPPVDEERDASAEAETDPPVSGTDALDALRYRSKETVREEKESYLRLLKDMSPSGKASR